MNRIWAGGLLLPCLGLFACTAIRAPDPGASDRTLLIAVTGLDTTDPLLAGISAQAVRADDVLATGMGACAIFELLGGGTALGHLQYPDDPLAWATARGKQVRVDVFDSELRSSPEWVHSGVATHLPARLPTDLLAEVHVIVVPRERIQAGQLDAFLELGGTRTLVVVAGIPRPPKREQRFAVGGDGDRILKRLRVPVVARGRGAYAVAASGRRTLGEVLQTLHASPPPSTPARVARWWNRHGGGILVDAHDRIAVAGTDRETVWLGPAPEDASADSLVARFAPAGDLLVLIRGSEGADLTSLDLLLDTRPRWSAWGLEPIDRAELVSPRFLQLDLAVEPEGDGVVLHDWTGHSLDLRLNFILEDSPWIGTPIRDADSRRWLGVNSLNLRAWSRDWWYLTRAPGFEPERWWTTSVAGVDLLWVHENEALPVPVRLDP